MVRVGVPVNPVPAFVMLILEIVVPVRTASRTAAVVGWSPFEGLTTMVGGAVYFGAVGVPAEFGIGELSTATDAIDVPVSTASAVLRA